MMGRKKEIAEWMPIVHVVSSIFFIMFSCCFVMNTPVEAQAQAQPTTDPSEASALNSIFREWVVRAVPTWYISGELCSGVAIDSTTDIENTDFNPGIKCSCNASTCHITQLRVYALNFKGIIPEALASLTRLTYLYGLYLTLFFLLFNGKLDPVTGTSEA